MNAIFGQSVVAASVDYILQVEITYVYNQTMNRREDYPWHLDSGWVFLITVSMVEHISGVDAKELLGGSVTVKFRQASSMASIQSKSCNWQGNYIRFSEAINLSTDSAMVTKCWRSTL